MTIIADYLVKLQPAPRVDDIADDGEPMTQLPYPFFVTKAGFIERQDLWHGRPNRVVGFVSDLARQEVDVFWPQAYRSPEQIIGMYLITADNDGRMSTNVTAIESVEVI